MVANLMHRLGLFKLFERRKSDKWFRKYCSEYFNTFEYLVWTADEIKKVSGILAKPAPKNEKLSPMKHFIS